MDLPIMTVEEYIEYKAALRDQGHLAEAYYRVDEALRNDKETDDATNNLQGE